MVLTFKLADDVVSSLKNVLLSRGFSEFVPGGICRKDTLARNLRRMLKTWGSIYGYAPETYILPREAKEFEAELEKHRQHSNDSPVIWICKPSSSSQGKNIFLITKAEELTYDCSFVVQRYIANPMLIGGYKYDLRIYDPSDMTNLFSHLTNASINKDSPDLFTDKDVIGAGCKWTMSRWFDYLESVGVNPYLVWEKIKDIAILTLLPIVAEVPDNTRCFELFGFDIMLDETFKPWIIEVNASPAIAISGPQDTTVKIPLLNDLLDAIGFPASGSLSELSDHSNFLPVGHPLFDPKAAQRAIEQARATAQAAAAAAGGETHAQNGVLNTANRGDRVQRVPRIVKMQSTGRAASNQQQTATATATPAAATSAATSVVPPSRSRIPVPSPTRGSPPHPTPHRSPSPSPSPSQSPSASPSRSPSKPSKIPLRRMTLEKNQIESIVQPTSKTLTRAAATAANPAKRAQSASKRNATSTPANATTGARSTTRSSMAPSKKPLPTSHSSDSAAAAACAVRSVGRSRVTIAPSASSGFVSTGAAPQLIGDFERIFPFDQATTEASDSIATAAVLKAKAAAPTPVLFSSFAKSTVTAVKSRIRARDRVVADRAKDPTLPLRFAFSPSSLLPSPSPWTEDAIAKAVERAKEAARHERARIGITEQAHAQSKAQSTSVHADTDAAAELEPTSAPHQPPEAEDHPSPLTPEDDQQEHEQE